ncbi:hypothetical protein RFI_33873, partial [Reticulomyxa filosa]
MFESEIFLVLFAFFTKYCVKFFDEVLRLTWKGNFTFGFEARKASQLQPDLNQQHRSAAFLNNHGLNSYFTEQWNRHWICEGVDNPRHVMPRYFLSNLMEAQSFEKIVMHSLTFSERKIICRLITGKVGLNDYLYNIQRSESPDCIWREEETVEHFLMECLKYQTLLPDRTWKPDIRTKVVKAAAKVNQFGLKFVLKNSKLFKSFFFNYFCVDLLLSCFFFSFEYC